MAMTNEAFVLTIWNNIIPTESFRLKRPACGKHLQVDTGQDRNSEFVANHITRVTCCSLMLRTPGVNALFTPGKLMTEGPESTSTSRSKLLWILDKLIARKNCVNHITFPRLQLVVEFRSRRLTFDVCLSQTSLIEMNFSYNHDLNLPRVRSCSLMPGNRSIFCLKPKSFLDYILFHDIWQEKEKSLSTSMSTLVLVAGCIEQNIFPTVKECISVPS